MTIAYVDLADYVAIAAAATGLDPLTIMRVANLDLADSALHAPAAGFGDTEFYPDFVDKAAVLIVRLARNHPLPDGNKRAAWLAMRNGRWWQSRPANGTSTARRNGCARCSCPASAPRRTSSISSELFGPRPRELDGGPDDSVTDPGTLGHE